MQTNLQNSSDQVSAVKDTSNQCTDKVNQDSKTSQQKFDETDKPVIHVVMKQSAVSNSASNLLQLDSPKPHMFDLPAPITSVNPSIPSGHNSHVTDSFQNSFRQPQDYDEERKNVIQEDEEFDESDKILKNSQIQKNECFQALNKFFEEKDQQICHLNSILNHKKNQYEQTLKILQEQPKFAKGNSKSDFLRDAETNCIDELCSADFDQEEFDSQIINVFKTQMKVLTEKIDEKNRMINQFSADFKKMMQNQIERKKIKPDLDSQGLPQASASLSKPSNIRTSKETQLNQPCPKKVTSENSLKSSEQNGPKQCAPAQKVLGFSKQPEAAKIGPSLSGAPKCQTVEKTTSMILPQPKKTNQPTSLFGSSNSPTKASLFGGPHKLAQPSLFGVQANPQNSNFGPEVVGGSLFGSNAFGLQNQHDPFEW